MKTIKIIITVICTLLISMVSVGAMTLEEAIDNMKIINHPEYLEKAEEYTAIERDKAIRGWWLYTIHEYPSDPERTSEEAYNDLVARYTEGFKMVSERCFLTYVLDEPRARYAVQYAESGNLNYLLSEPLLSIFTVSKGSLLFDLEGNQPDLYSGIIDIVIKGNDWSHPTYDNFTRYDEIQEQLDDAGAGEVLDCKIVDIYNVETSLYIECEKENYMVLLNARERRIPSTNLEVLKLYPVEEYLKSLTEQETIINGIYNYPTAQMLDVKPTYETEAEALQQAGLLQGNENGLDLLKPLTRAEAVTLLIRAMGLEEQTVNYPVSQFSDIASDNWASPYAALAKDEGITNGVSETEFAPDDRVTADQFATFTLRAAGESDFDYTQGTQILIDRGIITAEQAETMDLFTRGDMAKIIYEAREKGLL